MDITKYSRKIGPKKHVSKTVNLSQKNSKKLTQLNLFLSPLIRDYIDSKTIEELLKDFDKARILYKKNVDRIVSSITLTHEQAEKIENINLTALVNTVIDEIK